MPYLLTEIPVVEGLGLLSLLLNKEILHLFELVLSLDVIFPDVFVEHERPLGRFEFSLAN